MTFAARIRGVLLLDVKTFEEIESDTNANLQAFLVVVGASVAAGVGAGVRLGVTGLLRETFGALIGWVMWAAVTWVIGSKLLPEPQTRTDMGELLRVIGYAYAPNLFGFFAFIPALGVVISTLVAFWLLAATILAVRQALDYVSTWRAAAVVLIGWLIFVVIQWVS
ncbi:MAG TPA: YIP1 family protein [Vicinamibacterales bacterium]|jgi:Yip1 domain|nr:YIP1 family protein [Vicinamibacterales bacterium]